MELRNVVACVAPDLVGLDESYAMQVLMLPGANVRDGGPLLAVSVSCGLITLYSVPDLKPQGVCVCVFTHPVPPPVYVFFGHLSVFPSPCLCPQVALL